MVLVSCGFHLRGSVDVQTNLQQLAIREAPGTGDIAAEIRRTLKSLDVDVLDAAPMVLQLQNESTGRRVLSVDSLGRAQVYDLLYSVTYSLLDADGTAVINNENMSAHRNLQFDPNAVLGTNTEQTRLYEEMRRDVANRIVLRVAKVQPPGEAQ